MKWIFRTVLLLDGWQTWLARRLPSQADRQRCRRAYQRSSIWASSFPALIEPRVGPM
jgi:hypothetical protein